MHANLPPSTLPHPSLQSKRLHHVLYLDGEEEWLDLSNEMVVWARAMRGSALSAGHFLSSEFCNSTWSWEAGHGDSHASLLQGALQWHCKEARAALVLPGLACHTDLVRSS
jgi:hypothetical protein